MKVVIGADHAGFLLKAHLVDLFKQNNVAFVDMGTTDETPVDYPDFSLKVAMVVASEPQTKGIIVCGSGVGAGVVANKVPSIRASVCHDTYSAHQGVEHDDMNVLTLGARVIGFALAEEIVWAFLKAKFTEEERHQRRLFKLKAIEAKYMKS